MQVFCFFLNQEGNAWAYATPNFQTALEQQPIDALKQACLCHWPHIASPRTKFWCTALCAGTQPRSSHGSLWRSQQAAGCATWERVRMMHQPDLIEAEPDGQRHPVGKPLLDLLWINHLSCLTGDGNILLFARASSE